MKNGISFQPTTQHWTCDHCGFGSDSYYGALSHCCTYPDWQSPAGTNDESVLAIRLYNAQQVAADLAKRLNDLHREACMDEPLAAMLVLPLIGDANHIQNVLAQMVELKK